MNLSYIDNVYCINIKTSNERKNHMKKEFYNAGIDGKFIDAITPDMNEYNNIIKKGLVINKSKYLCTCVSEKCIHLSNNTYNLKKEKNGKIKKNEKKRKKIIKRKLRKNEIAICLSHLKVYKKIIDSNDSWALVCEDDISFIDNFLNIISNVIDKKIWNSKKPIIIYCGGNDNYGLYKHNNINLIKTKKGINSNYCYLLNKKAAILLIDMFFPIDLPEDTYKIWMVRSGKIKAYKIRPSIVSEHSTGKNGKRKYNRLSI